MMGIPRGGFTPFSARRTSSRPAIPTCSVAGTMSAMFSAGMQLTSLVNELAELRRREPTDDLISALVNAEDDQETLARHEIAPFFILLAVAGQRHGADRHQPWHAPAVAEPGSAPTLAGRSRRGDTHCGGGDRSSRVAGDVHATHGDTERDTVGAGVPRRRQGRIALRRREPRSACVRRPGILRRAARPESPRGVRRPRSALLSGHLARRSSPLPSANSSTDCRTSKPPTSRHRSRRWVFRSSVASSAFQCGSRPQRSRVGT